MVSWRSRSISWTSGFWKWKRRRRLWSRHSLTSRRKSLPALTSPISRTLLANRAKMPQRSTWRPKSNRSANRFQKPRTKSSSCKKSGTRKLRTTILSFTTSGPWWSTVGRLPSQGITRSVLKLIRLRMSGWSSMTGGLIRFLRRRSWSIRRRVKSAVFSIRGIRWFRSLRRLRFLSAWRSMCKRRSRGFSRRLTMLGSSRLFISNASPWTSSGNSRTPQFVSKRS